MDKIQVFLDSDVVISSALSNAGASYEIIFHRKTSKVISKTVHQEIVEVVKRLGIRQSDVKRILHNIKTISVNLTRERVLTEYGRFVIDEEDSHVVAGAHRSESRFLLTHNIKHYQVNKIHALLKIVVLKPGFFLQYLRSLS